MKNFVIMFALVFAVSAVVSFLYSWLFHGTGIIDWGSSVRLGIILGIVLSWVESRK
ncbi:MAG: hypothetical protein ACE5D2_00570 [Fidelibacterota bacterium]